MHFPASNDKKYIYLFKIDITQIELFDELSIHQNFFLSIPGTFGSVQHLVLAAFGYRNE